MAASQTRNNNEVNKFFEIGKAAEKKIKGELATAAEMGFNPPVDYVIKHSLKVRQEGTSLKDGGDVSRERNEVQGQEFSSLNAPTSLDVSEVLYELTSTVKHLSRCEIYDASLELSLDMLLIQACVLLSEMISKSPVPPLNIPLQYLVKNCDVYNVSIWSKNKTLVHLAIDFLSKKNFVGLVHEVAQETKSESLPDWFSAVEYGSQSTFIVKLCREAPDNGNLGLSDIQNEFVAGRNYWEDADTERKFSENHRCNAQIIYCIKVEDACRFWAYFSADWRKQLEELRDILQECLDEEEDDFKAIQSLTEPPHLKDLFLIETQYTPLSGVEMPYIRVRVIALKGNRAQLWCVDFAECFVQGWNLLRRCPPEILKFPILAKLCQLSGLVVKPPAQIIRSSILLLVTVLSRWNFEVDEEFLRNFFKIFLKLCKCPDIAIRRLSMLCIWSISTLENALEKQSSQQFHCFVNLFLHAVESFAKSPGNFSDGTFKEIVLISCTLRTLLFNCPNLRLYFAIRKGLQLIMDLIQMEELDLKLKMELWKVLKAVFGSGPYLGEEKPVVNKYSQPTLTEELSQDRLPRKSIKHLLEERHVSSQMADPFSVENHIVDDGDYLRARPKEKINDYRFLIKGNRFRVQPSDTAIMLERRSIRNVVDTELISVVCALLNSRVGGSAYIGIDQNNTVEGLSVSRKHRDDIRLSFVASLDKQLIPHVPPEYYEVIYLKVYEKYEPQKIDSTQHLQHVIEVKIKPARSTLFKLRNGRCYFIENGKAKQVVAQEMRNKLIEAAEQQPKSTRSKK